VQRLRTLIRNARKEQADESPPRSFRELFQAIKAMVELTNA
jgi:ribosome-associated protein